MGMSMGMGMGTGMGMSMGMGMGTMMPQSIIGGNTMLPSVMGTTALPPVPMVSQMGMPMGPPMTHSSNIMNSLLPTAGMNMTGMAMGMGTAPMMPQNNSQLNLAPALGMALLDGAQMGFPQDSPMMMH